jgi:choline-glycine betaine transporter
MARETPSHHHDDGVQPQIEAPSPAEEAEDEHRPVDRVVFGVAAGLTVAFIAWGVFGSASLGNVATAVLGGIIAGGGWAFVLTASGFVIFALWLALSRYGRIPLGRDNEAPEFRTTSWIAMMFSAGMGIGLMFYGVAEPLSHFTSPPPGTAAPGTPEAFDVAMATTLFHWTLTRGRSTPWLASRSPTAPSAAAAHS